MATPKKLDVLVADDEPDIREVLIDGLSVHGVGVRAVANGRDAVLESLRKIPDAVILDILMPVVSGRDALSIFKLLEPLRPVPVLMLTALKSKEEIVFAMKTGAADYIGKPFEIKDAVERIRRAAARAAASAPPPIFRNLRYTATARPGGIRIVLDCPVTEECVEDLGFVVKGIGPLHPLCIELDFKHVPSIEGKLAAALSDIRDDAARSQGEVIVVNFDAKRYPPASARVIKNIFRIEDETAEPEIPKAPKMGPMSDRDKKILSNAMNMISGLRYDIETKGDYVAIDFAGDFTAEVRDKITLAFNTAASLERPVMIRLDRLNTSDDKAMAHLVEKLRDFKTETGLKIVVVTKNQKIEKSFKESRGHLVTGLYDKLDRALADLRS